MRLPRYIKDDLSKKKVKKLLKIPIKDSRGRIAIESNSDFPLSLKEEEETSQSTKGNDVCYMKADTFYEIFGRIRSNLCLMFFNQERSVVVKKIKENGGLIYPSHICHLIYPDLNEGWLGPSSIKELSIFFKENLNQIKTHKSFVGTQELDHLIRISEVIESVAQYKNGYIQYY